MQLNKLKLQRKFTAEDSLFIKKKRTLLKKLKSKLSTFHKKITKSKVIYPDIFKLEVEICNVNHEIYSILSKYTNHDLINFNRRILKIVSIERIVIYY
jgi:hypothetical protein